MYTYTCVQGIVDAAISVNLPEAGRAVKWGLTLANIATGIKLFSYNVLLYYSYIYGLSYIILCAIYFYKNVLLTFPSTPFFSERKE